MSEPAPLEPARVLAAFYAGIAYHDALMAAHVQRPEARGRIVGPDERLDALFEEWHSAIAEALGVEP